MILNLVLLIGSAVAGAAVTAAVVLAIGLALSHLIRHRDPFELGPTGAHVGEDGIPTVRLPNVVIGG